MYKNIATLKTTNEIIKRFNLKAVKKFGQNFIIEPKIVEKIALSCKGEDCAVIEVGAGIGALSEYLIKYCKYVRAYEIDKKLVPILKQIFDGFDVYNEDFLNLNLDDIVSELRKEYGDVVLCANLPYYITTPILFKVFDTDISTITVMVQKEVSERLVAKAKTSNYNGLSVMVNYLYDVSIILNVNKNVFNPKPNVDSCVVQLNKKQEENINRKKFFDFIKVCFKQRRKTLYNNLKEKYDTDLILSILDNKNIRAQELEINDFINLFKRFENEV